MRKQLPVLLVTVLLLFTFFSNAQLVSGNAFLQGSYVEVGIGPCGNFASTVNAPSGYHARGGPGTQLGFVADPAQDGWAVGTPNYIGDYFLPGSPEEGWGLTVNGTDYNNNQICGLSQIPGSIINYTNASGQVSATWQGAVAGLNVNARTYMPTNALYFITEVTITNTSLATINGVYYMRNVDPDMEQPLTGNFTTNNSIVYQNPDVCNRALVSATGQTYSAYLGLGSIDSRAKVTHGGFSNRSALAIWNGTGLSQSGSLAADEAISVAFNLGNLAPNQSVTFAYAYILSSAQLTQALAATNINFNINGVTYTTGNTANICSGSPIPINLQNTGTYTSWTWSPATGLNTTTGTSVIATAASPIVYTATGTGPCGTVNVAISLNPVITPVPGNAGAITGPTNLAPGQTGVTYSIASVANATSYNWTLPPGSVVTSGSATSNSITITASNTGWCGNVSVQPVNVCGTGASSSLAVCIAGITTGTVATTACPGSAIAVPFTIGGTYNAGNVFTAQLSNSSGSFASPTSIGTLTGTAAGTINATIPGGTASGSGYRIRVVSSNPAVTGTDNGTNITVSPLPGSNASASTGGLSVCAGQTNVYGVTASANSTGYNWAVSPAAAATLTPSGRLVTVAWSAAYSGAAVLSCTPTGSCSNGTPVNFNVTVNTTHGVNIANYPYQGTFGGKHYYLANASTTWSTAKTNAEGQCTNLVAISSATEQAYVQNILNTVSRWSGFTDEVIDGNFIWVNGESNTYTNWNAGEPNGATAENDGEILSTGKWNDGNGVGPLRGIMERTDNEALSYVSVSDSALCAGSSFTATFSNTGVYDIGNVFKVELSDNASSFATAVTIGSSTSSSVGGITCTIPAGTANGSSYQIRLISSSPIDTLLVPVNFLIGPPTPSSAFTGTFIRCQAAGTSVFSVPANPDALSYNWSISPVAAGTLAAANNTITVTWSAAFGGNATIGYSVATTCTTSTSATATVAVIPWQPASSFTESMGSVGTSTSVATHETNNGFDNDALLMTASTTAVVVNNTNVSTGYTGASGAANVQIPTAAFLGSAKYFTIEGINTTGLNNMVLRYGVYNSGVFSGYSVSYSTDGTTFTTLQHSLTPIASSWQEGVVASGIPQAANLRIRFTGASFLGSTVYIDDVRLTYNNNTTPVITAGGPTELCPGNSVTLSPGTTYVGYSWSNAASTQNITVNTPATYNMYAVGYYGCLSSISNNITVTGDIHPPTVNCKPATTYLDASGNATITVNDVLNSSPGSQDSTVFNYTGSSQTFTVPAGITSVTIKAYGAQGGTGAIGTSVGVGGLGGYATGSYAVTPGQVLNVYVGGTGSPSVSSTICCGGFNGGGNAYGTSSTNSRAGGGGASDIRVGGTALANRILVAGGGGGGCWLGPSNVGTGGAGGGLSGVAGNANDYDGGGGTQSAGGANGCTSCCSNNSALTGSLGQGGGISVGCTNTLAGGGGGYYGGGAGNNAGGGSSYIGGVTGGSTIAGVRNGNGQVVILWNNAPVPATSDNCAVTSVTASQTAFTCSNIGANTVTVTAADASANSASCNAVVTVVDTMRAVALCNNVTLTLDTLCAAALTVAQVNNGSHDNCSIASMNLSKTSFNASNIGTNNVLLTVVDGSGNTSGCFSNVTVNPSSVTPSVVISANPGSTVCAGTPITFSANITYGGASPTYSWKLNGTQVSTSPTYTSATLVDGDQVRCDITSSIGCVTTSTASSNTITVNIVAIATWYLDADADGHYINTQTSCTSPGAGYTLTAGIAGDCDDNDNGVWQSGVVYIDNDGDHFGAGSAINMCFGAAPLAPYVLVNGDCDDTNDGVNPAVAEICGNGVDDNCDGNIDEGFPQIVVSGNGISIANHSTTTSAANYTFFGNVITNTTTTRTFRIINSGINNTTGLSINFAALYVNTDFTISIMPVPGLGAYDTTDVEITFHPTTAGLKQDSLFIQSSDCANGSFVFRIEGNVTAPAGPNTWLGNTSDWHTATNWSNNTVPAGCSDDVIIPNLAIDPIVSSSANVGNVSLQNGATLTLNADLHVCGNWAGGSSSASKVLGGSDLILSGSTLQTLSGKTEFNILHLDNAAGASLQGGSIFDIFTEVDLQTGTLTTTGATLRFHSTSSSHCAIIDNFSSGYTGIIVGNIIAQRSYDAAAYEDAHYMGSPVNGPNANAFGSTSGSGAFIIPTVDCDETQLGAGSPSGKVYTYDESHGSTCQMAGWKVEASSSALTAAKGYSVRKTGAGMISLTGAPHLNNSYSQSATNGNWNNLTLQGRPTVSGWTMVSNPYLATLDLTGVPAQPGFDAVQAVWNVSGPFAGTYTNEDIIAPFQAFFVRKSNPGGSATYTIDKSNLSKSPQVFHALNNAETLTLFVENTANGLLDKTTVGFNANATNQYDNGYDAIKLVGSLTRHTLYSYNGNPVEWLSKNINQSIAQTATVNVGFEPGANGNYNMSFDGLQSFDPTSYIVLEDKKLNVFYDVRNGNYSFTAATTDDWKRFVLHFTPPAEFSAVNSTCEAVGQLNVIQPGSANWNYTLSDDQGNNIGNGTLNNISPLSISVPAGVYTVTLVDNNNYTVVKQIQVGGVNPVVASFTQSALSVQAGEDVTFTSTTAAAVSSTWNFGDGSSANNSTVIHNYANEGTYVVTLSVLNADGCSSETQQLITVTAKAATGITELQQAGLALYPNPATDVINVQISGITGSCSLKVFNSLGAVVIKQAGATNGLQVINTSLLAPGTYFVEITSMDGKVHFRRPFVKQ